MTKNVSAGGASVNLVSKYKSQMTEFASAVGANGNFPTRIEGAKKSYMKLFPEFILKPQKHSSPAEKLIVPGHRLTTTNFNQETNLNQC